MARSVLGIAEQAGRQVADLRAGQYRISHTTLIAGVTVQRASGGFHGTAAKSKAKAVQTVRGTQRIGFDFAGGRLRDPGGRKSGSQSTGHCVGTASQHSLRQYRTWRSERVGRYQGVRPGVLCRTLLNSICYTRSQYRTSRSKRVGSTGHRVASAWAVPDIA
eukprot:888866-Rhodomonas_salina.3